LSHTENEGLGLTVLGLDVSFCKFIFNDKSSLKLVPVIGKV